MSQTKSKYKNNLFSNHFLQERIQDLDEWDETDFEEKFDELKKIYDKKKGFLSEDLNEDQTQNKFIDPVLKALGHEWVPEARTRVGSKKKGTVLNPDYTFMDLGTQMDVHEDDKKEYFDVNYAVGDAKAWNRTLDKSTQDHTNPAFQIYNYVDRLRSDWGILTNGKKWRLYSYEKCAADIYFEIDLQKLLSGEKTEEKIEVFKYFYLFFRAESFEKGFLEKVYRQSVEYNEALEDDLEEKVYNALEVAVEGFFETNDIEKTKENIDLVHHSSLIFLYRVLFILNAESRDLLPTNDEAYRQAFGLTELKRMIVEGEETHIFQATTVAWDKRISRLFEGIDKGYSLGEDEIPAYNGGLFDGEGSEENHFLSENKMYGSYIKEILELLATRYDEDKERRVIVDYKDLSIRHLGSVYEGLLEHRFKTAEERKILKNGEWQDFSEISKDWEEVDEDKRVKEDELYLTNESGERKATGSYYTPEYIVEYVVENTVGPKVEEKISEAKEKEEDILPEILELDICDPAMGSGHFLTEATEFIAENIVQHADLKKQDIDENEDELNWAKRQVVQNCIYGVDINPLAVELGKLSLWIETMAEGKPLNFLDHHLKHGNSLIGSEFDNIFTHPTEDQKRLDSEDFNFSPEEARESFQEQYLEIEQMPEKTVEEIHEKEQAYKKFILNNTLYQQFQQLANIHTRQHFKKEANSSDYESFLINIGNPGNPFEDTEWFKNAQSDAETRNYFHWQLEFPQVFFGELKEKVEQKEKFTHTHTHDSIGFDAVIGNPPYVSTSTVEGHSKFFDKNYSSAKGKYDLYNLFVEKADSIRAEFGRLSYILPNKFMKTDYGEALRSILKDRISEIIDFRSNQVFESATTYTCVITVTDTDKAEYISIGSPKGLEAFSKGEDYLIGLKDYELEKSLSNLQDSSWSFKQPKVQDALDKIDEKKSIGEREGIQGYDGLRTNADTAILFEFEREKKETYVVTTSMSDSKFEIEKGLVKKCLKGTEISKYHVGTAENVVLYPYENGEVISEAEVEEKYPKIWSYLNRDEIKDKLQNRKGSFDKFYELTDPRTRQKFEGSKIVAQTLSKRTTACLDEDKYYFVGGGTAGAKGIRTEDREKLGGLEAIINSSLSSFYLKNRGSEFNNNYYAFSTSLIKSFGLPEDIEEKLPDLSDKRRNLSSDYESINLNIQDYLGNYSDGKTLGDLYTPAEGLSDQVLSDTSADRDSLRIGGVEFEERNNQLILKASARYKPDDSENIDEDELDRWGYFETESVPVMKFDVDDKLKPLIEEFVSLAVDEAGGFANFRESATKTNSVVDRLEKLTLPKLSDVESGLEKFIENREDAEELENEIQETDELIDAIVFNLYDLNKEEVETVLDSLDTEQGEKERILERFRSI